MGLLELLLIAVGLSMDAFAASLCKGMAMKKRNPHHSAVIALFFGGFQAAMPLIGWLLGKQFERYITRVDHWIAFGLLTFIGGKMICEVCGRSDQHRRPGGGGHILSRIRPENKGISIVTGGCEGIINQGCRISVLPVYYRGMCGR